jgi:hypothetical protein
VGVVFMHWLGIEAQVARLSIDVSAPIIFGVGIVVGRLLHG